MIIIHLHVRFGDGIRNFSPSPWLWICQGRGSWLPHFLFRIIQSWKRKSLEFARISIYLFFWRFRILLLQDDCRQYSQHFHENEKVMFPRKCLTSLIGIRRPRRRNFVRNLVRDFPWPRRGLKQSESILATRSLAFASSDTGLFLDYPLVMTNVAMENGHL